MKLLVIPLPQVVIQNDFFNAEMERDQGRRENPTLCDLSVSLRLCVEMLLKQVQSMLVPRNWSEVDNQIEKF